MKTISAVAVTLFFVVAVDAASATAVLKNGRAIACASVQRSGAMTELTLSDGGVLRLPSSSVDRIDNEEIVALAANVSQARVVETAAAVTAPQPMFWRERAMVQGH